ncbi:D-amino peptidase [Vibrio xiamenensis]|uniref:D-amino peptidase n=1 Tax=Vibrio xiamenensis TaxID=861298 RepID=A0A1G8DKL8_9VIBR|nr:M55 family metallopeptidase [Vibrio xiamenensis]SDH58243.1 D-amino peptidase [Vibrio xiamenensis]
MKIFISADIEGIAGVCAPEQCRAGNIEYEKARALMEQEVNAAIAGAFEAGATHVVVADSHGSMTNLRSAYLDPRAELIQSKPRPFSMVEGIDHQHFDGLFLIGYHSAAGEQGVLAHTINGAAFYRVTVNGLAMAEADLYSASALEHGTPLLLVSGDDKLQSWIEKRYPGVSYCCVKRAITTTSAQSLSPQSAQQQIHAAAFEAVNRLTTTANTLLKPPYHLQLEATKPVMADVFALIPGVEQLDARTVSYTASEMKTLISLLGAFSYLASTQS